jgi:hypothetical protein
MLDIKQLKKGEKIVWKALEKHLVNRLVETTPVKTGDAAGNWRIEPLGDYTFRLTNSSPYIDVLEKGSKAHLIKAKNKKFLRFKIPKGPPKTAHKLTGNQAFSKDGYVFSKMVWHPGTTGRFFVQRALEDQKLWDQIWDDIFKR